MDAKRFSIRDGVDGAENRSPLIQAAFDTQDRMAELFGGIPFSTLFGSPVNQWMPKVLERAKLEARPHLCDIVILHGSDTILELAAKASDGEYSKTFHLACWHLWFDRGILLPILAPPTPCRGNAEATWMAFAINQLIDLAGDFTYRTIWEVPMTKDLIAANKSIRLASEANVIYIPHNGLCCHQNITCIPGAMTDWCATSGGLCVAGSTTCVGDH